MKETPKNLQMTSNRPYLLRALYEWIEDNKLTTYVIINTTLLGVKAPKEHVSDGKIVLNISSAAVRKLVISNQNIQFDARFSGQLVNICAPITAVMAIYAKENGEGMIFDITVHDSAKPTRKKRWYRSRSKDREEGDDKQGDDSGGDSQPPPTGGAPKGGGKPHLTLVK